MSDLRLTSVDARPLLDEIARRAITLPAGSTLARSASRARQTGRVSLRTADELAVRVLGSHPVEIWGDAWL